MVASVVSAILQLARVLDRSTTIVAVHSRGRQAAAVACVVVLAGVLREAGKAVSARPRSIGRR